jgi:two-component system sensor histidine kinase PhoQ
MPIVHSLRARVLLWVSIALTVLFATTIVGLDAAFRRSTQRAIQDLLQGQLLGLIALAEIDERGNLSLPMDAINPQFQVADSGLYGVLWDSDGNLVWQSLSFVDRDFAAPALLAQNVQRYISVANPGLPPLEALLMGIAWEFPNGRAELFTFGIAVSLTPYDQRQQAFRRNLIGWFAGITIAMLLVLTGLLTWVLRPLRRLEIQVRDVELGALARLTGEYPSELTPLAANLNTLIDTERRRLVRYRNTLDDLAHSLKTPLAAMRTLLSEQADHRRNEALDRELDRMDQRVSYQLRRARASGASGLGVEPVRVAPVIDDLIETLDKVYRGKRVRTAVSAASDAVFHGDLGDLTEILGNLIDNAYKYCRSQVHITARALESGVVISIGDDGPGIPEASVQALLERGSRADESIPGQGIGLAVVRETVDLYRGTLSFGRARLGGAEVTIELKRAGAAV